MKLTYKGRNCVIIEEFGAGIYLIQFVDDNTTKKVSEEFLSLMYL